MTRTFDVLVRMRVVVGHGKHRVLVLVLVPGMFRAGTAAAVAVRGDVGLAQLGAFLFLMAVAHDVWLRARAGTVDVVVVLVFLQGANLQSLAATLTLVAPTHWHCSSSLPVDSLFSLAPAALLSLQTQTRTHAVHQTQIQTPYPSSSADPSASEPSPLPLADSLQAPDAQSLAAAHPALRLVYAVELRRPLTREAQPLRPLAGAVVAH